MESVSRNNSRSLRSVWRNNMIEEIDISLHDKWNFNFDILDKDLDHDLWDIERKQCCYCEVHVDKAYSYIIDCLKEAGLLPDDYKKLCCFCYNGYGGK